MGTRGKGVFLGVMGVALGCSFFSSTAEARPARIDLARLIVTPALEVGWESVGGTTGRLGLGINIQLGNINVFTEPRMLGALDRLDVQDEADKPSALDQLSFDSFVGLVLKESGTSSAVGLMRQSSSTKYSWKPVSPRTVEVTETTTTKTWDQRSYDGIESLEQYIAEVGILTEIMGTAPVLSKAVFPSAGVRFHRHFDMIGSFNGEEDRIRRQVVYTLHVVGPLIEVGGESDDTEREDEGGLPVGVMAAAEIPVFKYANAVGRLGSLPGFAKYTLSVGLKFPIWF